MDVILGLNLDAFQGPSASQRFNAPIVGVAGFLGILETYLGLTAPEVSQAKRMAIYLGCLQDLDNGQRFYSESLAVDSFGTAARLLAWRDEWRMGGWNGQMASNATQRLQDMADVEKVAQLKLPQGQAEHLHDILNALSVSNVLPIQSVTLIDPIEEFPHLWQRVLKTLPCVRHVASPPQGEGALREVQSLALEAVQTGRIERRLPALSADRLLIVEAMAPATAEHWLADHIARSPGDRLVVAESRGDALDDTVAASGGVRCGFAHASPLRPALQLLTMALELCWSPLDVHRLVEFLSHPVSPLNRRVREQLLRAVSKQPGIGGEEWTAVKASLGAEEGGAQHVQSIERWLECERWSREEGAPVQALMMRVGQMAEVMRLRAAASRQDDRPDTAMFSAAHSQCVAVEEALAELASRGLERVPPRLLEQLITYVTPAGVTHPIAQAQVGCIRSSTNPATCIEPADEVVWWMPASPETTSPLPWTSTEIAALETSGVQLRDLNRELTSQFIRWLRPLLCARQRFILVLPPVGDEIHPVRQLLTELVEDFEAHVLNLDDEAQRAQFTQAVPKMAWPEPTEVIELNRSIDLKGKRQSFTSLSELFNAPALYALKRVALLSPTETPQVDEDARLLGTLAHRLLEVLFAQEGVLNWSAEQARKWLRPTMSRLLVEEGAVLLMTGSGVNRARFEERCEHAALTLLQALSDAGATRVETEVKVQGELFDAPMTGQIDMLVHLSSGEMVILDAKWSGDKYYADSLLNGKHLQLAIYAHLLAQQTGKKPITLGYFIIEKASLYVTQDGVIPGAQVRKPKEGMSESALLVQAKTTWAWRTEQLADGRLDVVPPDPSDEFAGPEGTLPVTGPRAWDEDFLVALGGWE